MGIFNSIGSLFSLLYKAIKFILSKLNIAIKWYLKEFKLVLEEDRERKKVEKLLDINRNKKEIL